MALAYFSDLSIRIKSLLEASKDEVKIAVAWFTNPFLFKVVENLVDSKIKVKIIISDSSHNFGKLDFQRLVSNGAEILVYKTFEGKFMHNKFGIIDQKVAFSGSYNWSMNAENNLENILVAEDYAVIRPLDIFFHEMTRNSLAFSIAQANEDNSITQEVKEDNFFYELQLKFAKRLEESIKSTIKIGVDISTDKLYMLIRKYTAIGAAKLLTSSEKGTNLQPGFKKLARKNRLDLSFEWLVTQPEFKPLFTHEIIEYAYNKLELGKIEAKLPVEPKK